MRYIAALPREKRREFESLDSSKKQELFMIRDWTNQGNVEALTSHYATRSLQSMREYLITSRDPDAETIGLNRIYFPLLESHETTMATEVHWGHESRFRRAIGKVIASVLDTPEFEFEPIERGAHIPSEKRLTSYQMVGAVILNEVNTGPDGTIIASQYEIETDPTVVG